MKTKSIFKSRTALLALFTLLTSTLGFLSSETEQILRDHSAGILALLGLANLALRRITSGRVEFFPSPPYTFNDGNP